MKKLIQRIKRFIKPKNMDADQLADTAYIMLVDLYKEATKENDEFLDKLLDYINEKQKNNGTDTDRC